MYHNAASDPRSAGQQYAAVNPRPEIEDLGNQKYRIGKIEIDKARQRFKVSGQVLRNEPPIEYLITTKDGSKNYESVFEANANALEFNLACILIGLDSGNATTMQQRLDGASLQGDRVEVTLSREQNGKTISFPGASALMLGDPPEPVSSNDWVYTGSELLPDGVYLADLVGTLLGFVHKGESVIEHKQGIGIGKYGSVLINTELVPAVGEQVEIIIEKVAGKDLP